MEKQTERKAGFYWAYRFREWIVARWIVPDDGSTPYWMEPESQFHHEDDEYETILEERLIQPDEKKEG